MNLERVGIQSETFSRDLGKGRKIDWDKKSKQMAEQEGKINKEAK